jgi:predicted nuclease of predicted toxin-antitoxin system
MKVLADVNVDRAIVSGLRADGHAVDWLAEDRADRKMGDDALMQRAFRQGQVILTNDTGFTRHVMITLLPTHGIVLLRVAIRKMPRAQRNQRALEALRAYQAQLLGQFTTVFPDRVEQQPLPSPPAPTPPGS